MRTRTRRGAPLWTLLLLLVLLPVATLGAFALVLTARAADEARSSADAAVQVAAYGELARASAAVDQELLVVLVQATLLDEDHRAGLGITPALLPAISAQLAAASEAVRASTDESLARAAAEPLVAGVARQARAEVAAVRAEVDRAPSTGIDLVALRDRWTAVSDRLRAQQGAVVVAAATAATSTATVSAVRDVRLVADLSAVLTPDVVDYLAWVLAGDPADVPVLRWTWIESHTAVAVARTGVAGVSDTTVRGSALALGSTPDADFVDTVMTPAALGAALPPTLGQLRDLVQAAVAVSAQTIDVLDDTVARAQESAGRDGAAAARERDATVLATCLAVLATAVVAGGVGRRVTRSLGRLAEQADDVRRGRLVDVTVGGPREVRSVGEALGGAVGNLRRIQDQAGAVAGGRLTDPVLDEPLPGPLGEVVHASVQQLVASVRKRERLQDALSHEAAHDPLTDLPNRAQALRLTTAALHRARRAGVSTGLLFVDLDGFKGVNDRAGHAAGDAVLRTVGARMREVARAGDTVCRLGGDEFVVLVEAVGDVEELVRLGERLVRTVSRPVAVATATGRRHVSVGASVGVAVAMDGEVDGDELLAQADAAVYRAKHAGRGRVEVFDDGLRAHIDERRDVEEALRRGLAEGDLHVLYQPVLEVPTGALLGFEALPRWDRPGVGVLAPEAFVPVADQSDLVCELDRWVLRAAVAQLAAWRAETGLGVHDDGPVVSVNVSARFLGDPRVTDMVLESLVAAGLPARSLVLEIGEAAVVESPTLLTRLADLRGLGVRVALDDFGTGTTSIGALRHLPVDTLKVDGSFLSPDPADQRLVALMVAAAHASGLTVVAEGVEHADVLDRLAAEACDAAQGHHLSVPLPAAAAGQLFRARTGEPVG